MLSAIDFGKDFLTAYFHKRNADEAALHLADDVIWITPNEIRHLRSNKSVRDFIVNALEEDQQVYNVDVAAVLSVPNLDRASIVVFEINIIAKKKDDSVNLRCALGLRHIKDSYEIAYVNMSRKYHRTDAEQIRGFADALPMGIMTLTVVRGEIRLMYASAFFHVRLGWEESVFYQKADANPFFMLPYEEQKRMTTLVAEMGALKKPKPLSMQVTLLHMDGELRVPCQMTVTSAFKDGDQTMLYLVFDEITDLLRELERQKRREQREWKAGQTREPARRMAGGPGEKGVADTGEGQEPEPARPAAAREKPDGGRGTGGELNRQIEEIRRDAEKQIASVQIEANVRVEEAQRLAMEEADAAERLIRAKLEQAEKERKSAVEKVRRQLTRQYQTAREEEEQRRNLEQQALSEELQSAKSDNGKLTQENADLKERLRALEESRQTSAREYEERILRLQWQVQQSGEKEQKHLEELREQLSQEREQSLREAEHSRQEALSALEEKHAQEQQAWQGKEEELSRLITRQQQKMKEQESAIRRNDTDLRIRTKEKDKSLQRLRTLLQGEMHRVSDATRTPAGRQDAPDSEKQLEQIRRIAQQLPLLSEDLAAIAAMDPGERRLREEPFTISSCLELARRVMKPQCREKGIVFSVGTGKELPENVLGDKAGLELALLCVLENAVDNTMNGGRISLSAAADPPVRGREYCRFTVTDSGQGIPEERLGLLFDDPGTELSVARRVIAAMGGTIQVRSKAKEGSTFEIRVSLRLQ